jgi:hypothetical protein
MTIKDKNVNWKMGSKLRAAKSSILSPDKKLATRLDPSTGEKPLSIIAGLASSTGLPVTKIHKVMLRGEGGAKSSWEIDNNGNLVLSARVWGLL